jgi:hypothetical protein
MQFLTAPDDGSRSAAVPRSALARDAVKATKFDLQFMSVNGTAGYYLTPAKGRHTYIYS